jgi:hypothetical protein
MRIYCERASAIGIRPIIPMCLQSFAVFLSNRRGNWRACV